MLTIAKMLFVGTDLQQPSVSICRDIPTSMEYDWSDFFVFFPGATDRQPATTIANEQAKHKTSLYGKSTNVREIVYAVL